MNDKFLNRAEVMEILRIKSPTTFYKYTRQDKTLPYTMVGNSYRIKQSDLDKFIADRTNKN